ncbi:MAG TPA: hypothetical protein DEO82_04950 [Eubacterium sp.]|nr:hypothetical protein [Eubacterium sp.]
MKLSKKSIALGLVAVLLISLISPIAKGTRAASSSGVGLTESGGWFESAYVKWSAVSGASGYNVYVKGSSDSSYKQLDSMLIRKYSSYYRADAVGLKAGTYTLKVVPIISGKEDTSKQAVTGNLTVSAYDRSGFAFVNGTSSGAYNNDGTLKSNAQVIYVTEATKDTVKADIVTSSKGATTTATGIQNILTAIKKGYDQRPFAIRVVGRVTDPSVLDKGDLTIDSIKYGLTFEGIGNDATLYGWGLRLKNCSNVEVRNIGVMLVDSSEGDNVTLQQGNDHIWVHNFDSFYGMAGSDADQAKGDGALDCKKSTYVTFSYNHFYDNGKCNLLGLSEGSTDGYYITYHHNWYDHSDSRHPRVRYYSAHVYNNLYDGISKYGIGACLGSSIFSENNYFLNCKYPMMISMQGTDVADGNEPTFSKENGGMIKAYGNVIIGAKRFVDQNSDSKNFDAVVVSNKSDKVSSNYKSVEGSNTYNNFDTSSIMYSYKADSAADAKTKVEKYAGRMNGGDFRWSFSDADNESYAVNSSLMSALKAYKTSLQSVGGNSIPGASSSDVVPSTTKAASTTAATTAATTKAASTTQAVQTTAQQTASGSLADGWYYIKNINSQKYLQVTNNNDSNGANVEQGTGTGVASQKWYLKNLGNDYITLQNGMSAGRMLDVVYGTNNDGENIQLYQANGADAQTFKLVKSADGVYCLLTKCSGETKAVDVSGWSTAEGGNIQQWTYNGYACQQFRFEAVGGSSSSSTTTTKAASTTAATTKAASTTAASTTTKYMFNPSKGLSNSYFTAAGSISTDKGTAKVNGSTLSSCLKMDSKGSIKFTTKSNGAKLTVYVSGKKSGSALKVNGSEKLTGIGTSVATKTMTLGNAGTYEITKGTNETYIFYVIVEEGASSSSSTTTTKASSTATTTKSSSTTTKSSSATTQSSQTASSGDIYVSPNGKSSASGSSSDPMDITTAISKIAAGKTIWCQSGTYKLSKTILISESNSGKSGAYKKISNINGGTVTFDFTGMAEEGSNRGFVLDGSYWYFYGVDITGAGDNGMLLSGDNNIIEMCQFYANHDTGLQLSRYNTNYSSVSQWPSNNLIKNCTSYNNKDDATAENADGFAAKLTCGNGNVFDGCIAYCNSDDGWDLYAKPATGSIGVVTIKNCVAFGNGKLTNGQGSANGDMNGFKLGGSNGQCPTPHVVQNCLAFYNGATGFTDNGNGGALKMSNCTAVDNGKYDSSKANFMCYRTSSSASYSNLLSFYTGSVPASDKFLGKMSNTVYAYKGTGYYQISSGSFSGSVSKQSSTFSISKSDFRSVSLSGYSSGKYATNYHKVLRNSDGSINMGGLFQYKSSGIGSSL